MMGYRICYGKEAESSLWPMTLGWFLVFLLLVGVFWPQGRQTLRDILLPGDWAVTASALEGLVQDIRAGEELEQAVEGFCRLVLEDVLHGSA